MRSVTSCFNSTLYRKNLARFWPVWALYLVVWLITLPLQYPMILQSARGWEAAERYDALWNFSRSTVGDTLSFGSVLAALFGLAAAMAVFSYLYTGRSACMMHALPLRRESLFLTNYLAGLSFLLGPNLVVFVLTLAAEATSGTLDVPTLLIWLGVQSAACLFYFSFAAFCAMFTGNLLALPAFYAILNGLVMLVTQLLSALFHLFLYGYDGLSSSAETAIQWLTPLQNLTWSSRWQQSLDQPGQLFDPATVAIYAAAGVVLAAGALVLYRGRHMETAGDVVAIPVVRPLFKYGVAVCGGLTCGFLISTLLGFDGHLSLCLSILFWSVVGYFAAEMLLRKSFRVLSAWKGAAVLLVVLAALFGVLKLDLVGFQTRVPTADGVASVAINGLNSAPYDGAGGRGNQLTDPDQIARVIALHQSAVDGRDLQGHTAVEYTAADEYMSFQVSYTLLSGDVVHRSYELCLLQSDRGVPGTVTYGVEQLLADRALVRTMYGFDKIQEQALFSACVFRLWDPADKNFRDSADVYGQDVVTLWRAMLADFDAGTIGVRYVFDAEPARRDNTYTADLQFNWEEPRDQANYWERGPQYNGQSITLTPQATHTLAALKTLGLLDEDHVLITNGAQRDWELSMGDAAYKD